MFGIKDKINNYIQKREFLALYKQATKPAEGAGKILFWVPGGMSLMLHIEGAIASALRLRGRDVSAVICDGPFRACVKREIKDDVPVAGWGKSCAACMRDNSRVLDSMGIEYSFIGDYVPKHLREELWESTNPITWDSLDKLSYGEINVGKNAKSAILRYLQGYDMAGCEEIIREYAFSALITAASSASAIAAMSPDHMFISHGIYVDWGPALHTALYNKIPVTAWMASYLNSRFYYRHIDDRVRIDFHNMSHSAWEECKKMPLSPVQNERLDNFLNNRYKKQISFDMKHFKKYSGAIEEIRQKYAPVSGKPVCGIMTHINWDAVSDYSPMAYDSFDEWMLDTIREIVGITDVYWLIKIHPAESWDNPASGVQELIKKHFSSLPPHIKVVSAEDDINPYSFFQMIDSGITVYGTSGLELALIGKPVILAGEAHYGKKGFTYDGLDREAYIKLLHKVKDLTRLTGEQLKLARCYAYCYFIQRQVPLNVVKDCDSEWWSFQYDKKQQLLPGKDPFIDFICDRIIDGKDLIMDETLVALAEEAEEYARERAE